MPHHDHTASHDRERASHQTDNPSSAPLDDARAITRRSAFRALLALAGGGLVLGLPRNAYAARATQQTLDQLAKAERELAEAEKQLAQIGKDFEALSIEMDKTIGKIEELQGQIDALELELEAKQLELEAKQAVLGDRVSESYKDGPNSILNLLLSSKSFDELISNSRYVEKINDADKSAIAEIHDIQRQLEEHKAELESQKADMQLLKEQQIEQLEEMKLKQQEAKDLTDGLSKDVRELMAKRDAEYLAAVEEEERQNAAAGGTTYIPGDGQSSSAAAGSQRRVVNACHRVKSPGNGLCAMWVSQVFSAAGFRYVSGNANDMYNAYCTSSKKDNLKVGMVIAVSSHPHTSAGIIYGHIGIYVGDNKVMDNVGYIRTIDVDEWIAYYGATITPRWGWLGGWALS